MSPNRFWKTMCFLFRVSMATIIEKQRFFKGGRRETTSCSSPAALPLGCCPPSPTAGRGRSRHPGTHRRTRLSPGSAACGRSRRGSLVRLESRRTRRWSAVSLGAACDPEWSEVDTCPLRPSRPPSCPLLSKEKKTI